MKFAQIDYNNVVINIIEIADSDCLDSSGKPSEEAGEVFCSKVLGDYLFKRTKHDGSIRKRPAVIGEGYDPVSDSFMSSPSPGPWARASEEGQWIADFPINVHTGTPLTAGELTYISYYLRHTKAYRLCPAVLKNPDDEFSSKACVASDYMHPTFDYLATGINKVKEAVPHKIVDGQLKVLLPLSLEKLIDFTPVGVIIHGEFEVFTEHVIPLFNIHPQSVGRTPHELFRLIIEWAYAHTDLGNTELIAVTCHNLLRLTQMPLAVRNELLRSVPPQAVERYIRGEHPFAATDSIFDDPPMPPLFEMWFTKLVNKNRETIQKTGELVKLDSAPVTYPR